MSYLPTPLLLGAHPRRINVTLTDDAIQVLSTLSGGPIEDLPDEHRTLLTTIVIAKAAGGHVIGRAMVIEAADISGFLDHADVAR